MLNTTLRYRTFDSLLNDVLVDFQNYNLENFIEPQQLIKVVKNCNYALGLRIFKPKETILEIEKGKVKLPDDFNVLNFAIVCDSYTVTTPVPQGTWIEERAIPPYKETSVNINTCTDGPVNCQVCQQPVPCTCGACNTQVVPTACSSGTYDPLNPYGDYCIKPRVFLNCKNDCYELVQILRTETRTYKRFYPIKILNNPQTIDCGCPNIYNKCADQAWIRDGFLFSNMNCATIYINYQGMLEDDDGNLLCPDHDGLNEFYEYSLKKRILENLIMNDETVTQAKIQLIEQGYHNSRNNAMSLVNTPNYEELKSVYLANRKAQYSRYYAMFSSYGWINNQVISNSIY